MTRPVLGIMACTRQLGEQPAQAVMQRYLEAALRYANCSGVLVPALPDLIDAKDVAARLDALLLTGSPSNIAATNYGAMDDGEGPFDRARDRTTRALVEAMIARGRPVFGICRGLQEINVILGGTLQRGLPVAQALTTHHTPDGVAFEAMFAHRHSVTLSEHGLLAKLYGRTSLDVNSVHYQGVDRLAPGLQIEARAPDGLIEAFSATIGHAPVVAVQWHPEWRAAEHPESQAWFGMLGRAARDQALLEVD